MTPALRLSLLLAVFLIGGPGGPGFSHLTVLYTTAGYDSASAALLISYLGLVICVSKILCGQIYDRFGSRAGNWYVHLVFLAGLLLCCLAHLGGMLPAFAAMTLFGLGLPISAVTFAVWSADLFGDAQYEGAVRSLTVSYALGMLLFGPIPGLLADRFHSYVPAYALFALCLAVSLVILQRPTESWTQDTGPAGISGPSSQSTTAAAAAAFRDSHRSRIGIFRARWLIASSSGETPRP